MEQSIRVIDPTFSAVVSASAGTGKTWLLVSRIVRLLLNGARPSSILAITFTRKAAAEMQERLLARLELMATCAEDALHAHLQAIGLEYHPDSASRARMLYEDLLHSGEMPRLTTFHAFCQDILQRFPLEADVPPGFELLEKSRSLEQEALAALYAEASHAGDSNADEAIECLLEYSDGVFNLEALLRSFLHNRTDWWAFTAGQNNAAAWASTVLRKAMNVDLNKDPLQQFLQRHEQELQEFARALAQGTDANKKPAHQLDTIVLNSAVQQGDRIQALKATLLTKTGEPRSFKINKALSKALGTSGSERFTELVSLLQNAVLELVQMENTLYQYQITSHWYTLGERLIQHYQQLKTEQRLLDFADLEWKTCELITTSNHAHWIQYKLDERIAHILVDEFQDTNPSQWRLLFPLLEEFAANQATSANSVFLVGDPKQSIYSFRRAEPRLFNQAHMWMSSHLGALDHTHDLSRRSAPAVVNLVNSVFAYLSEQRGYENFRPHQTVHEDLWGHVELIPLLCRDTEENETKEKPAVTLRHPLQRAPTEIEDDLYLQEGYAIARRILALIDEGFCIKHDDQVRPVSFGDILILIPTRTHVAFYEQALRECHIPYSGADRGTLLDCPEIKDLTALLQLLSTPFNNVTLARVLRSPLFQCSDDDLMRLAQSDPGNPLWLDRLSKLADDEAGGRWREIADQLQHWHGLTGRLPVHDLLDRIFAEGDIITKYMQSLPPHLRQRARANFEQLIDLSLDMDAGRYPSLHRFLAHLSELRAMAADAPDEGNAGSSRERVQIMTVHGAKGLEAPVVFVADSASPRQEKKAHECIIDWPPQKTQPDAFLLNSRKGANSPYVENKLHQQQQRDQQEELNLLYVALTRARQFLFISGTESKKAKNRSTWYGIVRDAFQQEKAEDIATGADALAQLPRRSPASTPTADLPAATGFAWPSMPSETRTKEIAPSYQVESHGLGNGDADSLLRGQVIHRALEASSLLRDKPQQLLLNLAAEFHLSQSDARLQEWLQEAGEVLTHPDLAPLFSHEADYIVYTEAPVAYEEANGNVVYGIIDRLMVGMDQVHLLDFKTHRLTTDEDLGIIAEKYIEQMRLYAAGVARLYPGKILHTAILFTHAKRLIPITLAHDTISKISGNTI